MLRNCVVVLAALFLAAPAAAKEDAFTHVSCKGGANEVKVRVKNVGASVGLMTAELYRNEPGNFLKKAGRELRVRYAARAPFTEFCIETPGAGDYAVVVYHDRNANHKFDKGAFGLPVEPYGVSKNPKIRLAPPPLEKALFKVEEAGAKVEINLKD